jgi:hypothetical protein
MNDRVTKFDALYYPDMEPPQGWLRSFSLFFDTIRSVVPEDIGERLSPELREFAASIPNAYEAVTPESVRHTRKDDLSRIEKAFEIISAERGRKKKGERELIFEVDQDDGSLSIRDHVFLHNDKISPRVRRLLRRHELVPPCDITEFTGPKDCSVVDERASNIILSDIANRLARRKGWSSVTDQDLEFTVIALEGVRGAADAATADALAAAIISLEIPEEIQRIELKRYKEFRDAYADVRKPFQELVVKLNQVYRLGGITDREDLSNRVKDACSDFDSEVHKFRTTRFSRKFTRWIPVGIGSLATLVGAALPAPVVAIPSAFLSVIFQLIDKKAPSEPSPADGREVYQMIAGMRRDILEAADVRRLLV